MDEKKMNAKMKGLGIEGAHNLLKGVVDAMKLMDLDNPENKDHDTFQKGSKLLERIGYEIDMRDIQKKIDKLDEDIKSIHLPEDGESNKDGAADKFFKDFMDKHSQN